MVCQGNACAAALLAKGLSHHISIHAWYNTYLRSSIVGAATAGLQEMTITHDITQPKICNLDIHLAVQKEVLGLQVSVDHHVAVAVLYPRGDLLKEAACFFL